MLVLASCSSNDEPIQPEEQPEDIIETITLSYSEALAKNLACTGPEEAWDNIAPQADTIIYLPMSGGKAQISIQSLGEVTGIAKSDGYETSGVKAIRKILSDYNYEPSEPDVYIFNPYSIEANWLKITHTDPNIIDVEVTQNHAYREYIIRIRKTNITPKEFTDINHLFDRYPPEYKCRIRLQ